MGIFSNFFKSQPLPEDEIQESENVMRKLREKRQENTSQWVASIQDPNSVLPPSYTRVRIPPRPTIEDVDQREQPDDFVYTPPMEAMYTPFDETENLNGMQRLTNNSSTEWVARIFEEFEHQGNVFNTSAQGTNLVLSIHPPKYTEETIDGGVYGKESKVRFFKGYVSTSFWGMLLHGHHDKIDVYIVPAEAILEMTLSDIGQSGFSPFITIDSEVKNGNLEWHVGGSTIVYESIPNLAKELLGDLIKIASGKLKTDDLFAADGSSLKLDPGAAQNLSQVMRIINDESTSSAATAVKAPPPVQAAATQIANLDTFTVADNLVNSIVRDMAVLSRLADPMTPSQDQDAREKLSALTTAMRTLHGQVSTFVAQYKPKQM